MSLGMADRQGNLLDDVDRFLDGALEATSIYSFFHRERDALFLTATSLTCSTGRAVTRCRRR